MGEEILSQPHVDFAAKSSLFCYKTRFQTFDQTTDEQIYLPHPPKI